MSVNAAAVKTRLAQKPRTGVGESRSQTKKGMATILAIVRRFGRLTASSASERRRFLAALGPEPSVTGGKLTRSPDAHENRALAREADEAPLAPGRFGGRQSVGDEAADPADDPLPSHEQRPALDAGNRRERPGQLQRERACPPQLYDGGSVGPRASPLTGILEHDAAAVVGEAQLEGEEAILEDEGGALLDPDERDL